MANVSVAQKWVLGGREKVKSATFSATHLIQGAPFPRSLWVPHAMLDTSSAAAHLSLLSLQLVSLWQTLKVEADERHRVTGVKDSLAPRPLDSGLQSGL